MLVGIDASRAQTDQKTGTENYSFEAIHALATVDTQNRYRLYTRNRNWDYKLPQNFEIKVIPWPRFWTQGGLALEVLRNPPDVLFVPAHTLPILRDKSQKTVVTIHDLGAEFLPGYHLPWQREYLLFSTKYAVREATALIAVSEATKRDLVQKLGAKEDKIYVVHEGIDHQKFKIENSKLKMEKVLSKYRITKPFFLFVGTIQPRKNLIRLIEAFSGLNHDLEFVLVGKRGWLSNEIYNAPDKFGVSQRVKFLNYIPTEDLASLYSSCMAFVLPSLVEGFGLPVLEAMACGAPVILSKTSSLPEIGGEAAIYIDPYSVSDIKKGLNEVLEMSQSEIGRLRDKSFAQAQKFSWEKCARETLDVFKKII